MKLTVTCPQCQNRHEVDESMAGTRAQCRCGHILTIPRLAEEASGPAPIVVQCPSCLRRYEAKPSLAGTHPKCSCGATLSIPGPPEAAPLDRLENPAVAEPEAVTPDSPSSPLVEIWAEEKAAAGGPDIVLDSVPRRMNKWLLYFCLAGFAVPVLGLILALLTSFLGGGSGASAPPKSIRGPLGWASWCIPSNAKGIAAINVEKFSRSDVFRVLVALAEAGEQAGRTEGGAPGTSERDRPSPAEVSAFVQSLTELHVAFAGDGKRIAVLRTKADMSLEEAVRTGLGLRQTSAPPQARPTKTFVDIEYVESLESHAVLAKVAPNTFCVAEREKDLQEAILRRKRNEVLPLSDPLRRAWQGVKGDILIAVLVSQNDQAQAPLAVPGMPATGLGGAASLGSFPKPEWVALGVTTDSKLGVKGTVAFPNAVAARKCITNINDGMQAAKAKSRMLEGDAGSLPADVKTQMNAVKAVFQKGLELLRGLHVSSKDNLVQFDGTWEARKIEDFLKQVQSLQNSLPRGQQ